MDTMPGVPIAVSLSDILEVRGGPLREREVWALLCQSAAAIQDFFIKGASSKKDDTFFVISPVTLTVCRDGQVNLTPGESTWHGSDFKAPECCSDTAHILSDTATEKMFLYTLGKTLQVATEYGLCKNEYVSVSHHLDSLLEAMCEENPAVRIGLRSILEACDLHTRQHPEKTPYAQTICHLYSSVLGSTACQTGMDSSDNNQQRMVRSRRRPRHPHHHHHDRHSSPTGSPPPAHSRSRSRSRSRSQGTLDPGDGNCTLVKPSEKESEKPHSDSCIGVGNTTSLPTLTTSAGTLTTLTTTSSCTIPLTSSQDLNVSFASSLGDQSSLYHPAPAYQTYPAMPGLLSLHMENPAYGKYLQLKERQHRLKAAKIGKEADLRAVNCEGLSTPHSVPLPFGTWQGDMMDYMTDARSLASLMSYTVGSCMPELTSLDTHSAAPVIHGDGGSALSSNLSLLMQEDHQAHVSLPEEPKESALEVSSCLKRRREDDIPEEQQKRQLHPAALEMSKSNQKMYRSPLSSQQQGHAEDLGKPSDQFPELSRPSQQPAWKEQSVQHPHVEAQQQPHPLQQLHQFGSRDLTPTPDALPAKEYYGPEFVYRASHPVIRISLPLQGESVKNPALARRVIIVHLTGQKFEALVDPCMTGRQLFDAVVTNTALDDFFFFGLTYICDGEHFFLDADTKLHKMSPEGWREGAKGHMPPVTFTLYLRVKFYPDSLTDFRHMSSQHLLYLQLRRDILEERCMADDQQLLSLSGLALHAEFGDYSRRTMGHNYFVPEQYLPARVARRLGMGYVHDRALEAHRDALGLAPSQCEIQFIKLVQKLPEYGIHFYKLMKAKNDSSNLVWVGITQTSLLIADQSGSQRSVTQALPWPAILKISFNKRRFSVQPKVDRAAHTKGKLPKISFFTNSYRKGKYLLQLSTAQHRFCIRMRSRAAALENLGGHGELEDGQYDVFSLGSQEALVVEGERQGEDAKEQEDEKDEEGQQMFSQDMVASVESCSGPVETASVDSPAKQVSSPGTDSSSSVGQEEDRPEVPPLKYRSPPPYHLNLECLMEELSANSSVHAQDRMPTTAASSDMHASVNLAMEPGTEQTALQSDAAGQLANHISSPQLSEPLAADSSPHHHHQPLYSHPDNDHVPDSHLAPGQPSLGRQVLEVTLQKEGDKGIGITIVGGETTGSLDLGIFVKSVMKDGPAARTKQIKAGDRLIAINGISLEGVQHHEAVQLIRDSVGSVRLLLSQMQPPLTIKRKLKGTKTRSDTDDVDAACLADDKDLDIDHISADHPNIIPSTNDTTVSQSHHSHHFSVPHGYHLSPDSTDFMKSGSMKPVSNFQSGYLAASELDNGNGDSDAGDGVLLEEEMLAAAELNLQNYEVGDINQTLDAEAEFDKETQELQILGDIANMTVDNSDTDSDFESAVQATVEGKVRRSSSKKTCDTGSSLRKSMSVTSPESVIYEVVLEKEKGSLGIMISEGEQYNRLYVQSLVPGGPAQSGGILQPGDCLLELNGLSLKGVTRKDVEKTMQTAPDVCLLKVARTKSLDALSQGHGAEQLSKGDGSMQKGATTAVSGETSFEEMAGLDSQISPPSAFASAAPTPSRDAASIPIVPPPPPLTFDTLHVEDERSNNTQSDIDSDVLDSSRSELEQIYRSAEKYLDSDVEDIELDAVAGVANLHMDADDGIDGAGSPQNRHSGSNQQGDRGDISDDISAASETVRNTSPPTVRSVGAALHPSGKSQSKSLLRQDHVIETTERESDSAADEQASDKNQVEEFTVNLIKSPGGGLGFTVVGGVNTTGGCYIKAVVQDPALSDGRLHAGDRLIQVNGQDMTGLSHFEAVTFLRQTPKEVSVKVWRYYHATQPSFPPPHKTGKSGLPDKIQHVTGVGKQRESYAQKSRHVEPDENSSERVWDQQQASTETTEGQQTPVKNQARCLDTPRAIIRPYTYGQQNNATQGRAKPSTTEPTQDNSETNTDVVQIALDKPQLRESLGFSLVQRPMDCGQTGIFIKTLSPGGIAHTDGQLRVGDRLLQVNGEPLIGCSHTKAVRLLRETVGTVVLTISRFPEDQFESNATEDGAVPSGEIGRLTNEDGQTTPSSSLSSSNDLSDDDINDILDEAINFLDRQDGDDSRTVEAVSGDQSLPASSSQGEGRTPGLGETTVPTSSLQTASHSLSSVVVPGDRVLSGSLPPVKGEDSGTSNHMPRDQDVTQAQCTSFVRQISSVEIPEDLTTRCLLSLPVLRITKEVEERRVQLLQCLADALEQEEPLLEFEKLRQMKATDNMEVAKLAENKSRNRYRNVLPYDYNRVELQTTSPEENSYINASDVQLSVKGKAEPMHYIACQGPLMATQGHFWQMVWEAGTNVVAMLTQEMELGKVKCHRYWPESPGQSLDLCDGRYSVHLVKEERLEDFDVRRLRMTEHSSGEEREVVHLHYIAWPDHGVPDSAYPMLLFVRLMHQLHQSGPFVVHCSAGIGRSGVLMAVDTALARIETGDELDLFDIVSEMRQQRYGMIQTQDQYLFCYTACMEALLSTER